MRGFTLIEVTIVLAILSTLFLVLSPSQNRILSSVKLEAAAREAASILYLAQKLGDSEISFKSDENYYIVNKFDISSSQFKPLKTVRFPSGISCETNKTIKFSSNGFPQVAGTGTIVLKNKNGIKRCIVVSPIGRIRII